MLVFQELFDLLVPFFPNVLPLIGPKIKGSYWPRSYDKYPMLSYKQNGFPDIDISSSRVDVSQFFHKGYNNQKPEIDLAEINGYEQIIQTVMAIPSLISYFKLATAPDSKFDYFRFNCENLIVSLLERYYQQFGQEFSSENLVNLMEPMDRYFNTDTVYFDIGIPLLFIQFDVDYMDLDSNIALRRISDGAQRARYSIVGYSPSIVSSVYMAATHELVLKNYHYDRPRLWFEGPFSQPQIYPADPIRKFVSIINMLTQYRTGYAQCLIYPHGWADHYHMDLMVLKGASLRAYPSYFDNYYWNNTEYPSVGKEELNAIQRLFSPAMNCGENKLDLALKRLYKSLMREEEEDVIIDLIVGLEMLLGDKDKGEITHKLALRIAALLGKESSGAFHATQVFANVKKIYAYRSTIVHGSHKVSKNREIKLEDEKVIPSVDLARNYLSEVLKILIQNPKYLDPAQIDQLLLDNTMPPPSISS